MLEYSPVNTWERRWSWLRVCSKANTSRQRLTLLDIWSRSVPPGHSSPTANITWSCSTCVQGRLAQCCWASRASPDPALWPSHYCSKTRSHWHGVDDLQGALQIWPKSCKQPWQHLFPPPRPQRSRCFLPLLSHNTIHKGQASSRYGNLCAKSTPSSPLNPTPPCN